MVTEAKVLARAPVEAKVLAGVVLAGVVLAGVVSRRARYKFDNLILK